MILSSFVPVTSPLISRIFPMYDFRKFANTDFHFIGVFGKGFPPVGNFFAFPFDL
jgi:hypothetical protein